MSKPIVCLDTETTGLSPQHDYIVQLSAVKFDRDTFEVLGTWDNYICPPRNFEMNPAAEEVHGISKDFLLKNGKKLKDVGPDFLNFIDGCDFLGYNSNAFDHIFLYKDFKDVGLNFPVAGIIHYDARLMEIKIRPNKLGAVFERYTGKTMEQAGLTAHNSLSDVLATIEVFKHQMEFLDYETVDLWPENELFTPDKTVRNAGHPGETMLIVFNQGKYKDVDVYTVLKQDANYMQWAAKNMFSSYTLGIVRKYCKDRQDAEKKSQSN